ncbi:MAG: S1 RNA-binding domain-containing protein [Planctomycetota bacterium]
MAERLGIDERIVAAAVPLLDRGVPIPYLARYRRVEVGGLDERSLRDVRHETQRQRELEQRREFIERALGEREDVPGKALKRIRQARTSPELEYLYEPYRPHGRTSASLAREKGYGPVAEAISKGEVPGPEMGADEDAISGVVDILAHTYATDSDARMTMLRAMEKEGVLHVSPGAGRTDFPPRYAPLKDAGGKLNRIPPNKLLALLRGEGEAAVHITLEFPDAKVRHVLTQHYIPNDPPEVLAPIYERALALAIRLMRTAVSRDALAAAKTHAEESVVRSMRIALHDQLLFPPAGARRVLGVDPAPRGSVPVACVGLRGEPLAHDRPRFFGKDEQKIEAARESIRSLVDTHGIELIAIGNGRGRHECEAFLRDCLADREDGAPPAVVVSEAGLGSYASSPAARRDLPSRPVPIISAISLARRLQDPLVEFCRLDPKQIVSGPGMEDVEPRVLTRELHGVVEHCVNHVGVDLNRAPADQLAYVCGLDRSRARELVSHREKNGPFLTVASLAALSFMGELAFEQSAGFLRIHGGQEPLDATSVHPATYTLAARIAEKKGVPVAELIGNADLLVDLDAAEFADEKFPEPVVDSVVGALLEAGRDPRPPLEVVAPPAGVRTSADLRSGMRLAGRVTNVTTFGAFVDLGVQQDGLVHVSEIADRFVKDPSTVVHVGQLVNVRVLGVDDDTGRISLSMRSSSSGEGRGDRGRGGDKRRGDGARGDGRRGGAGGGRGGGDRKPSRPRGDRRGPPRKRRDDESVSDPAMTAGPPAPPPPTMAVPTEDPVPADMSEEEFMRRKMEELKKRFG